MHPVAGHQLAVFSRNHRIHLDEAVALCAADSTRKVTFRASVTWASARQAVSNGAAIPVYFAAVSGAGSVEYIANLVEVQTHPHRGDPTTERLLKFDTNSTAHEGLWERSGEQVRTLYTITKCRKLARPVPISKLLKASDGKAMSQEFKYSYALVLPVRGMQA